MAGRDDGSVTKLLKEFKEGDPAAVEALWQRYFARLVALARRRLQNQRRLIAADEEDAALSTSRASTDGPGGATSPSSTTETTSGCNS